MSRSVSILQRTPSILTAWLDGLGPDWTHQNEGGETWTAFDIIGHLIHGELTDWPARMRIIMSDSPDKSFTPFDRFAQFHESKGKSLASMLKEFAALRHSNLLELQATVSDNAYLSRTGIHPVFGTVTLSELLSTWVVHDLNHIAQIARVMARQYKEAVGPWLAYLRILQ